MSQTLSAEAKMVHLTIDGHEVEVPEGTTIFDAAARIGINIPVLCHQQHMTPVAVCRVCSVDIGGRVYAPACYRTVDPGMNVKTHHSSPAVEGTVRTLVDLLMSDHPSPCAKHEKYHDCELELMADRFGVKQSHYPGPPAKKEHDESSMVIAVDHNACILCDRCSRGCNEIRHNEVIGRAFKGYQAKIAFDLNNLMGNSTCVSCGECMISCPTGALTNRKTVQVHKGDIARSGGEGLLSAEELETIPLFEGVSRPFLRFNEGAVRRVRFKRGDIICREGESGSTAFYIEEGEVSIRIKTPYSTVKNRSQGGSGKGFLGLVSRFSVDLVKSDKGDDGNHAEYIHIDAPISLKYGDPVASLEAGDIFGEMTCMNHYPRSATVEASGDVTLLEMDRNVLYILQRNKKSKALLDERYRRRTIDNHLRSVPIFADIAKSDYDYRRLVDLLRDQVELLRKESGQVIFEQGDLADSLYLIRTGFVKVSQKYMGAEYVLNYIGPGAYFGEIGLLSELPELRELGAIGGRRVATCTSLDHVDLVRISADAFNEVLEQFPQVRTALLKTAEKRLLENAEMTKRIDSVPLAEFLSQGLFEAQSLLVLDLEKCTRCDECTKACADSHAGVTRLIREGLRFDKFLVASSCRSCLDPYCLVGCPVNAIQKGSSREIQILDHCIGCGKCADNCPYGNINMHSGEVVYEQNPSHPLADRKGRVAVVQQKATTCDLCKSYDGTPSCVYACPHDAAHRMKGTELLDIVKLAKGGLN